MSSGRRRAILVVALLVAFSGCNAFPSADGTEIDGTEIDGTETDDEGTLTPLSVDLPSGNATAPETPSLAAFAGVSVGGSVHTGEIVESHRRYLSNRSFTLDWSKRTTGESGTSYNRSVAVRNESTFYRVDEGSMVYGRETTYVGPDGAYRRVGSPNGSNVSGRVAVDVGDPSVRYGSLVTSSVDTMLVPGATSVDVVERDGRYYARLFSRTVPEIVRAVYSDYAVEDFTATAWLAREGYVRSFHYEYTLRRPGDRRHVELRYTYRDVGGTSVTRPAWVDALEENETTPATDPTPSTDATADEGATTDT